MAVEPRYVGVSPAGDSWVAVIFDAEGLDEAIVVDGIGDLWLQYEDEAERILVDVPIGLVEEGTSERECDDLARSVLDERAAAIVSPPARPAVRKRRYPAARKVHRRKTGEDLPERAFELAPAVAAVDELLQELPEARPIVAESRAELCFRAFAGEPLEYDRSTAGGYAERMRTLAEVDRDAPPTVQRAAEDVAGSRVRIWHVVDAVALAYTARPGPGERRSLPEDPPTDPTGLPMRTVYRATDPLPTDDEDDG